MNWIRSVKLFQMQEPVITLHIGLPEIGSVQSWPAFTSIDICFIRRLAVPGNKSILRYQDFDAAIRVVLIELAT